MLLWVNRLVLRDIMSREVIHQMSRFSYTWQVSSLLKWLGGKHPHRRLWTSTDLNLWPPWRRLRHGEGFRSYCTCVFKALIWFDFVNWMSSSFDSVPWITIKEWMKWLISHVLMVHFYCWWEQREVFWDVKVTPGLWLKNKPDLI